MKRALGSVMVTALLVEALVACGSSSSEQVGIVDTPLAVKNANVSIGLFGASGTRVGGCSGVLIGARTVLTAGHCIAGKTKWTVVSSQGQKANGVRGYTADWIDFESSDAQPANNDLGIIMLDRDIKLPVYPKLAGSELSSGANMTRMRGVGNAQFEARTAHADRVGAMPHVYSTAFAADEFLDTGGAVLDDAGAIVGVVSGRGEQTGNLYIARIDSFARWLSDKAKCAAGTTTTATSGNVGTQCIFGWPFGGDDGSGSSSTGSNDNSGSSSNGSSGSSGNGSNGNGGNGSSGDGSGGSSSGDGNGNGNGSGGGTSSGNGNGSGSGSGSGGASGGNPSGGSGSGGSGGTCSSGGGFCSGDCPDGSGSAASGSGGTSGGNGSSGSGSNGSGSGSNGSGSGGSGSGAGSSGSGGTGSGSGSSGGDGSGSSGSGSSGSGSSGSGSGSSGSGSSGSGSGTSGGSSGSGSGSGSSSGGSSGSGSGSGSSSAGSSGSGSSSGSSSAGSSGSGSSSGSSSAGSSGSGSSSGSSSAGSNGSGGRAGNSSVSSCGPECPDPVIDYGDCGCRGQGSSSNVIK